MLPKRHPISEAELQAEPLDEPSPPFAESADPLRLVRPVAIVGLVASLAGRAMARALHGAGQGLDTVIAWFDLGADFATFSFAILALVATSLQLVHTARESRLGFLHRTFAIAFGAIVVTLATPSLPFPLPDRGLLIVAGSSLLVALAGAKQALYSARTRAFGFILFGIACASLLRIAALFLSLSPLPTTITTSHLLGTASVAFDGLSLAIAFTWLTTRERHRMSWPVTIALSLAVIVFWSAKRGSFEDASFFQIVSARSLALLSPTMPSFVLPETVQLFEVSALALALAALFVKGPSRAMKATLSLMLLARPMTDVPLSAIAVTLSGLTVGMLAVDKQSTYPQPRPRG